MSLAKIRNLPLYQRKIIFWIIISLIAILAFSFWLKTTKQKLKEFGKKEFLKEIKLPPFEEGGFEIENLKEDFEKIKEIMKEIEKSEVNE